MLPPSPNNTLMYYLAEKATINNLLVKSTDDNTFYTDLKFKKLYRPLDDICWQHPTGEE